MFLAVLVWQQGSTSLPQIAEISRLKYSRLARVGSQRWSRQVGVDVVVEPQGRILLVYFVADESGSMDPYIGELNDGLLSLQAALQREPWAAGKVRFSVIGFSATAFTYLEPADMRFLQGEMQPLTAQSTTSYTAAFNELDYRLSVDIPSLKQQGFIVHRPSVFFLTDGRPTGHEDWRGARQRVLSRPDRPNILGFGIGDADRTIIGEIATKPNWALMSAHGSDIAAALEEFFVSLTQSVISSGQVVGEHAADLQFEPPEGCNLAIEYDDDGPSVHPNR